jgi:peptide deformylase
MTPSQKRSSLEFSIIAPVRGIKCSRVSEVNPIHLEAARRLTEGLGIAAPQFGVFERWFLWFDKLVIDPKIHWKSKLSSSAIEGCLSLDQEFLVDRPDAIVVSWKNEPRQVLVGLEARVFLHEFDHLDGIFIDDKKYS